MVVSERLAFKSCLVLAKRWHDWMEDDRTSLGLQSQRSDQIKSTNLDTCPIRRCSHVLASISLASRVRLLGNGNRRSKRETECHGIHRAKARAVRPLRGRMLTNGKRSRCTQFTNYG